MTSLTALLTQLRDSEPLPHRVHAFDAAILQARKMERLLDEIVEDSHEDAAAATQHATAQRQAVAAARAAGLVVDFPARAIRRAWAPLATPGAA